jgi:cardiolipin synthase
VINLPAARAEPGGIRGRFATSWRQSRRTWRAQPGLLRSLLCWGAGALLAAAGTTVVLAPGTTVGHAVAAAALQLVWIASWLLLVALHLGLNRRSGETPTRTLGLPNGLTLLRVLLIPTLGWAILAHPRLVPHGGWAVALIFLVGFSDVLDGLLARLLRWQTVLGRYLDHGADVLIFTGVSITEYLAGLMPGWLLGLYLVRYPGTALVAVWGLAKRPHRRIQPTWIGKASTLVAGAALFVLIAQPLLAPGHGSRMSWVHVAAGAALAVNCVALVILALSGNAFAHTAAAAPRSGHRPPGEDSTPRPHPPKTKNHS